MKHMSNAFLLRSQVEPETPNLRLKLCMLAEMSHEIKVQIVAGVLKNTCKITFGSEFLPREVENSRKVRRFLTDRVMSPSKSQNSSTSTAQGSSCAEGHPQRKQNGSYFIVLGKAQIEKQTSKHMKNGGCFLCKPTNCCSLACPDTLNCSYSLRSGPDLGWGSLVLEMSNEYHFFTLRNTNINSTNNKPIADFIQGLMTLIWYCMYRLEKFRTNLGDRAVCMMQAELKSNRHPSPLAL